MWSVLQRELRAQARNGSNPWLRVLAGLATGAMLFSVLALIESNGMVLFLGRASIGPLLFVVVHIALSVFFALVTPLLAADCISRERRDGTLELLCLTPLKAREIVLGKVAIHLIRALSLWLAALPLLCIPILFGALTARVAATAMGWELILVLTGISAGLAASCRTQQWNMANGLAMTLMFLRLLLIWGVLWGAYSIALLRTPGAGTRDLEVRLLQVIGQVLGLADLFASLPAGGGFSPPERAALLTAEISAGIFVVLGFGLTCLFAGRRVVRLMAISPPTAAVEARRRFWLAPRFATAWFHRTRKQRLHSNPILWLQQFAPTAGLAGRGWLSVVMLAWLTIAVLCAQDPDAASLGWAVPPLLLVAVAFASAGSFQREIEEGTLELILVTPVRFRQIVAGRVWTIWRHFLPPMVLAALLAIWWIPALDGRSVNFRAGFERDLTPQFWVIGGALTSLATLPPIGLRCALRRLNPLFGWPMTLAIGVVGPLVAAMCVTACIASLNNFEDESSWTLWLGGPCFVLFQAVVATWWWRMCEWDLASRHFMLRPFRRRHA